MQRTRVTLVELLVVIGVIAVLIAMLLPALNKARSAAIQVKCVSQQRQIMMAFHVYAHNHNNYLPPSTFHNKDDFHSNYWVAWWNRFQAGQYLNIKTRGKDYNPSTYAEGWTGKLDPKASHIYCPAYYAEKAPVNSDLGYGVNTHQSSKVMGYRLNSFRRAAQLIVLADVKSGINWEKFHFGQSSPGGSTDQGLVYYRHNRNTIVSFADGHSEVFQQSGKPQVYGFNTGLHAAYRNGSVTPFAAN